MEIFPFSIFGLMFTIVPILMFLIFVTVFGIIIFNIVQGTKQYQKNNKSPILTVDATVVAKRMNVFKHNYDHNSNHFHNSSSTTYFITFEVLSGDRLEFRISSNEYGMIVERDIGKLTFQGTRFLGFERIKMQ